jgi:hypothetical protein
MNGLGGGGIDEDSWENATPSGDKSCSHAEEYRQANQEVGT